MSTTGWQPDGSYVPCATCGWVPEPYTGPGYVVRSPGTTHYGNCSIVPHLTATDEAKLRADLAEMDRCRKRAEVESRGYVIG